MRDTDADWNHIADSNPYYGVLANERFLNPDEEALKVFFATGEADITHLLKVAREKFGEFNPKSALDFGCGVGRLAIPLARISGSATGIDIASGMLKLAAEHAVRSGVELELLPAIPSTRQFDWVNSMIVLQHIPPRRGYGIIKQLWDAVAVSGILTLQITIFKDSRHMGELSRDLKVFRYDGEEVTNYSPDDETGGMSMYDYDLSRIFSIVNLADGQGVYMEKTDHGGCHGFRIYVRKR